MQIGQKITEMCIVFLTLSNRSRCNAKAFSKSALRWCRWMCSSWRWCRSHIFTLISVAPYYGGFPPDRLCNTYTKTFKYNNLQWVIKIYYTQKWQKNKVAKIHSTQTTTVACKCKYNNMRYQHYLNKKPQFGLKAPHNQAIKVLLKKLLWPLNRFETN